MSGELTGLNVRHIHELLELVSPAMVHELAIDDSEGGQAPKRVSLTNLSKLFLPYNGAQNDVDLGAHDIKTPSYTEALSLATLEEREYLAVALSKLAKVTSVVIAQLDGKSAYRGTLLESGYNLNSIAKTGTYTAPANAVNSPSFSEVVSEIHYIVHINSDSTATNAVQIAIGATTSHIYLRNKIGNTWSAWSTGVTPTEIGYLKSVTSNIQTQLNALGTNKQDISEKTIAWSEEPNDQRYPTEKLVKDSLDEQAEAISGHIEDTENPHEVTKTQVGLGNADNTSDANKPVSIAQQTALNLKEDKSNKVTAFQEEPTDTAYPSEKLVDTRFKVLEGTGAGSVKKAINDAVSPLDTRVTYLESVRGHLYGVRMQKISGICSPTYDAVGLSFRPQIDTITNPSDFSSVYPWRDIKTVKVDEDKNILCTIDDASFDTTVGDITVKIPVFWHRYWTDASYEYYEISDTPRDGFFAGGFYNPDGTIKPYALVGAVKTSNDGRIPHSWTDTPFTHSLPLYSTTAGFQLDALNKSSTNKWSNIDHQAYEMVWHLIFVEIGGYVISPNSQVLGFDVKGAIGQGINGMSNSYSASNVCTIATVDANTFILAKTRSQYFKVGMLVQIGTAHSSQNIAANRYITDISEYDETNDVITVDGATFTTTLTSTIATWAQPLPLAQLMALKNESGYVLQFGANNQSHVCYRGVWDLWGNMYDWMSGLYRYDLQFYACFDWTKMNVNDPRGVAGWVATGIAPDIANGYLKTRQVYKGALGEIGLPSAVGAGSSTWYAAYAYYFNSGYMGLRAVGCGGRWNLGALVGFFWLGYYSPALTYFSLGGRLIG